MFARRFERFEKGAPDTLKRVHEEKSMATRPAKLTVSTAALALALSAHWIGLRAATPLNTPPQGYRDWKLLSVAILGAPFNDIRAKLGNDLAIGALRSVGLSTAQTKC